MLLLVGDKVVKINNERVHTVSKLKLGDINDAIATCSVFVDGEFYINAVAVYLEHKQYALFETCYDSVPINEMFKQFGNVIFCDMGVGTDDWQEIVGSGTVEFNDYTEKAREGISYFEDIVTDEEKSGLFKNMYYVKSGVKV